jgi:hypothetical protein
MSRKQLSILGLFAFVGALAIACSGAALTPVGQPTSGEAYGNGSTTDTSSGGDRADQPGGNSGSGTNQAPADQQLIVYTGSLQLEVSDLTAAVAAADQAVRNVGGRIEASSASDTEHGKFATVTYRIPAARWAEAVAALKALAAKVVDENIGTEDVTAQVVDLDARLANLRVTETALQAIMDRATTITDVLKVQSELTKVRGDIERLTAERDHLAAQAALGTLEVGFNLPAVAEVQSASNEWNLGREIDGALAALVRLGQGVVTLLIWVAIVLVPLFVPILLVLYAAFWLRRRWQRDHPAAQVSLE